MSWDTEQQNFKAEFDQLNSTNNVDNLISKLNVAVNTYLASKKDEDYTAVKTQSAALQALTNKYADLNDRIVKSLTTQANNTDLTGALTANGTLQTTIKKLEKRKKELQVEVDTALARDEVLRSKDTKANTHQLFLLDRPVRKGMIPYLWGLAILFIGVGLVLYKVMLPPLPSFGTNSSISSFDIELLFSELLLNKTVLITLLVCIIAIIVTAAIKVSGLVA
jgi:hypothetical protein